LPTCVSLELNLVLPSIAAVKSSSAKNASPPSIIAVARFFRPASSASLMVARMPNCFGRSSGVIPLLAQTPWKSGRPSGIRGTDHDDLPTVASAEAGA
jgi:hypothetical protein